MQNESMERSGSEGESKELSGSEYENKELSGEVAIPVLTVIAWVNLILGCIGSLFIYVKFGTEEVPYAYSALGTHSVTNPIGIVFAVGSLLGGDICLCFLLVICSMAKNLIAIREDNEENTENLITIMENTGKEDSNKTKK